MCEICGKHLLDITSLMDHSKDEHQNYKVWKICQLNSYGKIIYSAIKCNGLDIFQLIIILEKSVY